MGPRDSDAKVGRKSPNPKVSTGSALTKEYRPLEDNVEVPTEPGLTPRVVDSARRPRDRDSSPPNDSAQDNRQRNLLGIGEGAKKDRPQALTPATNWSTKGTKTPPTVHQPLSGGRVGQLDDHRGRPSIPFEIIPALNDEKPMDTSDAPKDVIGRHSPIGAHNLVCVPSTDAYSGITETSKHISYMQPALDRAHSGGMITGSMDGKNASSQDAPKRDAPKDSRRHIADLETASPLSRNPDPEESRTSLRSKVKPSTHSLAPRRSLENAEFSAPPSLHDSKTTQSTDSAEFHDWQGEKAADLGIHHKQVSGGKSLLEVKTPKRSTGPGVSAAGGVCDSNKPREEHEPHDRPTNSGIDLLTRSSPAQINVDAQPEASSRRTLDLNVVPTAITPINSRNRPETPHAHVEHQRSPFDGRPPRSGSPSGQGKFSRGGDGVTPQDIGGDSKGGVVISSPIDSTPGAVWAPNRHPSITSPDKHHPRTETRLPSGGASPFEGQPGKIASPSKHYGESSTPEPGETPNTLSRPAPPNVRPGLGTSMKSAAPNPDPSEGSLKQGKEQNTASPGTPEGFGTRNSPLPPEAFSPNPAHLGVKSPFNLMASSLRSSSAAKSVSDGGEKAQEGMKPADLAAPEMERRSGTEVVERASHGDVAQKSSSGSRGVSPSTGPSVQRVASDKGQQRRPNEAEPRSPERGIVRPGGDYLTEAASTSIIPRSSEGTHPEATDGNSDASRSRRKPPVLRESQATASGARVGRVQVFLKRRDASEEFLGYISRQVHGGRGALAQSQKVTSVAQEALQISFEAPTRTEATCGLLISVSVTLP